MGAALGAATGLSLGLISAHTLFAHSWTALILWGIVGLGVGGVLPKHEGARFQTAHTAGTMYGFFVSASFLIFGFQGASSQFPRFLVVVVILGLAGAACGLVLSMVGQKTRDLAQSRAN